MKLSATLQTRMAFALTNMAGEKAIRKGHRICSRGINSSSARFSAVSMAILAPRIVALGLVLCLLWSFAAGPAAIAAHVKGPQDAPKQRPQSLWMSPAQIKHLKAQALHVNAMQHRAQSHLFAYRQANASRDKIAPVTHPMPWQEPYRSPLTILSDVGELAYAVPSAQVAAWNHELTTQHPNSARAARLNLWLGEWQLAHQQQPEIAFDYFQAAQRLTRQSDPVYGVAAYDRAMAFYDEGAYADAMTAFGHILAMRPRLKGFDPQDAALWMRHAGACAGYHDDRARAGIPEPPRLDPLCAAASLAASLRALHYPFSQKVVLAHMHVTGEGSDIEDVVAGARQLGANAWTVSADDQGLLRLPKPLVGFVEHDHFISIIRADDKGVSYLCSDCGAWPGGQVNLTWKQWHMLDGGLYVVVTRPGTFDDRCMVQLASGGNNVPTNHFPTNHVPALTWTMPSLSHMPSVRLADAFSLPNLTLPLRPSELLISHLLPVQPRFNVAVSAQLAALQGHVILEQVPQAGTCGSHNSSNHCLCATTKCPISRPGSPATSAPPDPLNNCQGDNATWGCMEGTLGAGGEVQAEAMTAGPTAGDPVNLATGEEEYEPAADITVYNPHGPSVSWGRLFDSLRRPGQGFYEQGEGLLGDFDYEMNDFGEGWSTTYNVGVSDAYPGQIGTQYPKNVFFENGARTLFSVPALPTASTPHVLCQFVNSAGQPVTGIPFLVYANYNASGDTYSIVWQDRTQWITAPATTISSPYGANSAVYPLGQIVDRNGHAIAFHYGTSTGANYDGAAFQWPLLSSITNENGTALLTIARVNDGSGAIAAVYDCYGRSVLYHVAQLVNRMGPIGINFGELDHVSQLVPSGTGIAPDRYTYGYENIGYGYSFLHTISVPSPTGTGLSTATINYDTTYQTVTSIVDANGNTTTYQSVNATGSSGGGGVPGSSTAPGGTLSVSPASAGTSTNYTEVTISGSGGSYSYVSGFDNNMSGALQTDGTGHITASKVFNSSSPDPYDPTSETDGNGNTTQFTYDQYGNELTTTSPRGTVTTNTYSYSNFALGELMKTQTGNKTATTYAYNEPSGLVSSITKPAPGTVGTGATVTYAFQYDGYGDITQMTTPGNNAASSITTTFNYGSSPAIGQPLTVTDALGHATSFTYDAQANKTSQTDAAGNTTIYGDINGLNGYNIANQPLLTLYPATGQTGTGRAGMAMTYLYPDGPQVAMKSYDESGNEVREVDTRYGAEGETLGVSGSTEDVTYAYDSLYRRSQLIDGAGHTTSYFYNTAGQLYQVVYPGAGTPSAPLAAGTRDTMTLTGYDANGNLTSMEDGNGTISTFAHADPESRVTDIHFAPGPGVSALADTTYAYDAYGRISSMTDNTGSQAFTYDDNDSPLSVVTTYTGLPAETIAYAYYPDGSRQTMSTPAGQFGYQYDSAGRMTSLTNPFSETTSWAYASNNWLTAQQMANGDTTTIGYNGRGQIMDEATGQGSTTLAEFAVANTQGYDAIGNRLSVAVSMSGASGQTTYAYDGKNELIQEQSSRLGDGGGTYAYDAAENPTTFRGQSVGTANADNQLPGSNGGNTYDGNGNPVGYNGSSLTFDPQNRATSFGSALTCGYHADGLRAWKQTGSGRTYYLYDGTSAVCELGSSGAVTATNTLGEDGLVSRHSSGGSVFYDFDLSGNVAQRLGSSGNVASSDVCDAFGKRNSTDTSGDPFAFSGQWGGYTDAETGLVLLQHRFYDPAAGRWLTRDPISYIGGIDLYGYCQNNSVKKCDPLGWFCMDDFANCVQKLQNSINLACFDGIVDIEIALFLAGLGTCIALCLPAGETCLWPCVALLMSRLAFSVGLIGCLANELKAFVADVIDCYDEASKENCCNAIRG